MTATKEKLFKCNFGFCHDTVTTILWPTLQNDAWHSKADVFYYCQRHTNYTIDTFWFKIASIGL